MIDVKGLVFTYPAAKEPAVNDLEFSAGDGEIFGFLGPNGAGKSTTQRVLIGLLRKYAGNVNVLGRDSRDWGSEVYSGRSTTPCACSGAPRRVKPSGG